eukprot:TRINITY_DN16710_c0_g1_i1.p2 TRINITY_DN16710_c0_g1~~TRINITY_DN16710_c0_g1_i1.p2  ORF type:complete len:137 (-),score=24.71 TRINITY_DN16710_c0_g1_i1:182-592(-)
MRSVDTAPREPVSPYDGIRPPGRRSTDRRPSVAESLMSDFHDDDLPLPADASEGPARPARAFTDELRNHIGSHPPDTSPRVRNSNNSDDDASSSGDGVRAAAASPDTKGSGLNSSTSEAPPVPLALSSSSAEAVRL